MAITSATRDWGTSGPNIVRITATNTLAEVFTADYISGQADELAVLNSGTWEWVVGDIVAVAASDGSEFGRFDGDDFTTLIQMPGGNGEVTLPVVDGDFTVFDGTLGALKDAGYSASDPAKTKVVMAGSAVVANHIALFADTAGTIDDTAATAINDGSIQAGRSTVAGSVISYPATGAKGSLQLTAVANTGDTITTISNVAMGQASTLSFADPGSAAGRFLVANTATPFVSGNFPVASGTGGLMVDSGIPAANVLLQASVAMTAAQWNGMYAAPFILIAAPGANKLIIVESMQAIMTFVSADYAAGGVVAAQYDSTVHGAGVYATNSEAAADFFAGASTTFNFLGTSGNTVGALPFSTTVNKGLYLSNLTQAFTTGDSTWVIKVNYRIVTVA